MKQPPSSSISHRRRRRRCRCCFHHHLFFYWISMMMISFISANHNPFFKYTTATKTRNQDAPYINKNNKNEFSLKKNNNQIQSSRFLTSSNETETILSSIDPNIAYGILFYYDVEKNFVVDINVEELLIILEQGYRNVLSELLISKFGDNVEESTENLVDLYSEEIGVCTPIIQPENDCFRASTIAVLNHNSGGDAAAFDIETLHNDALNQIQLSIDSINAESGDIVVVTYLGTTLITDETDEVDEEVPTDDGNAADDEGRDNDEGDGMEVPLNVSSVGEDISNNSTGDEEDMTNNNSTNEEIANNSTNEEIPNNSTDEEIPNNSISEEIMNNSTDEEITNNSISEETTNTTRDEEDEEEEQQQQEEEEEEEEGVIDNIINTSNNNDTNTNNEYLLNVSFSYYLELNKTIETTTSSSNDDVEMSIATEFESVTNDLLPQISSFANKFQALSLQSISSQYLGTCNPAIIGNTDNLCFHVETTASLLHDGRLSDEQLKRLVLSHVKHFIDNLDLNNNNNNNNEEETNNNNEEINNAISIIYLGPVIESTRLSIRLVGVEPREMTQVEIDFFEQVLFDFLNEQLNEKNYTITSVRVISQNIQIAQQRRLRLRQQREMQSKTATNDVRVFVSGEHTPPPFEEEFSGLVGDSINDNGDDFNNRLQDPANGNNNNNNPSYFQEVDDVSAEVEPNPLIDDTHPNQQQPAEVTAAYKAKKASSGNNTGWAFVVLTCSCIILLFGAAFVVYERGLQPDKKEEEEEEGRNTNERGIVVVDDDQDGQNRSRRGHEDSPGDDDDDDDDGVQVVHDHQSDGGSASRIRHGEQQYLLGVLEEEEGEEETNQPESPATRRSDQSFSNVDPEMAVSSPEVIPSDYRDNPKEEEENEDKKQKSIHDKKSFQISSRRVTRRSVNELEAKKVSNFAEQRQRVVVVSSTRTSMSELEANKIQRSSQDDDDEKEKEQAQRSAAVVVVSDEVVESEPMEHSPSSSSSQKQQQQQKSLSEPQDDGDDGDVIITPSKSGINEFQNDDDTEKQMTPSNPKQEMNSSLVSST